MATAKPKAKKDPAVEAVKTKYAGALMMRKEGNRGKPKAAAQADMIKWKRDSGFQAEVNAARKPKEPEPEKKDAETEQSPTDESERQVTPPTPENKPDPQTMRALPVDPKRSTGNQAEEAAKKAAAAKKATPKAAPKKRGPSANASDRAKQVAAAKSAGTSPSKSKNKTTKPTTAAPVTTPRGSQQPVTTPSKPTPVTKVGPTGAGSKRPVSSVKTLSSVLAARKRAAGPVVSRAPKTQPVGSAERRKSSPRTPSARSGAVRRFQSPYGKG